MRRLALGSLGLVFAALWTAATPHLSPAVPFTSGTGPGGFDLANGAGTFRLWLDAEDSGTVFQDAGVTPSLTGDAVYQWTDKSGWGSHAQATNASDQRPAYQSTVLSGHAAVRFDPSTYVPSAGANSPNIGTADGMNITGLSIPSGAYTIFIVDQYYGGPNGRTLQGGGGANWLIGKWQGFHAFHQNNVWVSNFAANPAAANTPTIGAGTATGVAGQSTYYINAVNDTVANGGNNGPGTLHLGSAGTYPNEVSAADVSEIIAYTRALNTAERRIVENYLSAKYNVGGTPVGANRTLGGADLYAGDLDTNGDFDLDVIGIGQAAGLSVLSAGAAGYGLEAVGALADGEYVLAGHNQTAPGYDTDLNGRTYLDRVLYVDKTSVDGIDATITFDLSDIGVGAMPLGPTEGIGLLYSATDPFNFQSVAATLTLVGDTYTFTVPDAYLLDGYFALGAVEVPEPSTWTLLGLGTLGLIRSVRRRRAA